MIKVFKEEYQNCTIAVRTQFGRRVNIDTTTADAEVWSKIPEFEFLFEECTKIPSTLKESTRVGVTLDFNTPTMETVEAVVTNKTVAETINSIPNSTSEGAQDSTNEDKTLADLSLKKLRQKFPDIKDTSKAGFLNQLGQA